MLPAPANAQVYELTRWGKAAEDAIFALSRWAAGSPAHDVTLPLSNAAFMLSLRTMMDREKARALSIDLGFRVGGDPFRAQIVDGRLEIERADPDGADLAFEGDDRKTVVQGTSVYVRVDLGGTRFMQNKTQQQTQT